MAETGLVAQPNAYSACSESNVPSDLTSDLADESGALGQETLPP
jgi:hypothetical protein